MSSFSTIVSLPESVFLSSDILLVIALEAVGTGTKKIDFEISSEQVLQVRRLWNQSTGLHLTLSEMGANVCLGWARPRDSSPRIRTLPKSMVNPKILLRKISDVTYSNDIHTYEAQDVIQGFSGLAFEKRGLCSTVSAVLWKVCGAFGAEETRNSIHSLGALVYLVVFISLRLRLFVSRKMYLMLRVKHRRWERTGKSRLASIARYGVANLCSRVTMLLQLL